MYQMLSKITPASLASDVVVVNIKIVCNRDEMEVGKLDIPLDLLEC